MRCVFHHNVHPPPPLPGLLGVDAVARLPAAARLAESRLCDAAHVLLTLQASHRSTSRLTSRLTAGQTRLAESRLCDAAHVLLALQASLTTGQRVV